MRGYTPHSVSTTTTGIIFHQNFFMRKNAHGLFVFVDDYLFSNEVMSHFSMLKTSPYTKPPPQPVIWHKKGLREYKKVTLEKSA